MAAEGGTVAVIAARLGVSPPTVRLWIRRFREGGLDGIMRDAAGRGRPPAIDGASLTAALAAASTAGTAGTRSVRALARELGVSASAVWRALQKTDRPLAASPTTRRPPKSQ